jgi:hypothetical protein
MVSSRNLAESIERRTIERAERKIDSGKNHFMARSFGSSIALSFLINNKDERQEVIDTTNEGITRLLAKRGAEGNVYAIQPDASRPQSEVSEDFVVVTSRDEEPTRARRKTLVFEGEQYVVRTSTDDIDKLVA